MSGRTRLHASDIDGMFQANAGSQAILDEVKVMVERAVRADGEASGASKIQIDETLTFINAKLAEIGVTIHNFTGSTSDGISDMMSLDGLYASKFGEIH